jgi:hypothetical protein
MNPFRNILCFVGRCERGFHPLILCACRNGHLFLVEIGRERELLTFEKLPEHLAVLNFTRHVALPPNSAS